MEKGDRTFESLSLLWEKVTHLKKVPEVNEEAHSGHFDVDIIKFFMPVSIDLDQSIFEVDR